MLFRSPSPREGQPWSRLNRNPTPTQSAEIENPCTGRACVRVHGELDERDLSTNDRDETGQVRDRIGQSGLQPLPIRAVGATRKSPSGIKTTRKSNNHVLK